MVARVSNRTELRIPGLHEGQASIVDHIERFTVIRCGRRFGKSSLGVHIAAMGFLHGKRVGWFGPTYKLVDPQFEQLRAMVGQPPLGLTNESDKEIRRLDGSEGRIEFWSCDKEDPGRGRYYDIVILDEAGLIRKLRQVWLGAIRPTLSDRRGNAVIMGTPKGQSGYFNDLFNKGKAETENWAAFQMGTIDNPFIDPQEIEDARRELPDDIFKQEYEGIPADDGGNPFGLDAIAACFDRGLRPNTPEPVFFGVDLASRFDFTWIIGLNEDGEVVVSERFQDDWPETKRRVAEIVKRTPCLVDETGVGDPVVRDLQETCGDTVEGFRFSNSSKQMLMVGLRNDLQDRAIEFADERLKSELDSFAFEFREGSIRYSAPEGLHDDGVCALALACELRRRGVRRTYLRPGDILTGRRTIRL